MHDLNFDSYKRQNAFVTVIGMLAIFGIYIFSASKAPDSDNIGILIVPFVILIIYGPFISFIYAASRALQLRKHPRSFEALITTLEDHEPHVRVAAVEALKVHGDRRAINPLTECLNDEEEFIRSRVKEALEYLEQC